MKELIRPDREPDYISRSGCEYWFEELIKTNSAGFLRLMVIDENDKLCNQYRHKTLIKEIQDAWRRHLENLADELLLK